MLLWKKLDRITNLPSFAALQLLSGGHLDSLELDHLGKSDYFSVANPVAIATIEYQTYSYPRALILEPP